MSGARTNPNKKSPGANTAVHCAVWVNEIQCLKLLLEHHGDHNLQNQDGHTSLHIATRFGDEQCFRLLLDYGADPNILNNNGHTAKDIINHTKMDGYQRIIDLIDSYEFPVKNAEDYILF